MGILGPGLLVAATGVGAGDLANAGFAGSHLGLAILWAVVVGAAAKLLLNEGLARWQLASGQTLLEGVATRLGRWAMIAFLLYLIPFTFVVGAALISACGVTMHAILPIFDDADLGKLIYGAAYSAIGLLVAWVGGFKVVERVMAVLIAVMFVTVIMTAVLLRPDPAAILRGLVVPVVPELTADNIAWTVGLIGGVGGTVTILCYGYWMREERRASIADLKTCRLDLTFAYVMTALFGMAMIVIASHIRVSGSGSDLIVQLADTLTISLGATGRWVFLAGAWAAVFSSLLGVWQAVPYLFADAWRLLCGAPDDRPPTKTWPYRVYLLALATVPLVQISHPFHQVQRLYAVVGAGFIPILAACLLFFNRRAWVGEHANRLVTNLLLVSILLFAILAAVVAFTR